MRNKNTKIFSSSIYRISIICFIYSFSSLAYSQDTFYVPGDCAGLVSPGNYPSAAAACSNHWNLESRGGDTCYNIITDQPYCSVAPWSCPLAEPSFNDATGECEVGAPPVVCAQDEVKMDISIGGENTSMCVEPLPETDQCQDISGYFNDQQVCNDARNACTETGGSYGYFNGQEVCVPSNENLPECPSGSVMTETGCSVPTPPNDPDNPDVPNSETPDDVDTDGDGIPNKDDPDIDGDGVNNGLDLDQDGDGIPDVDDPDPQGLESGEENSVGGGGTCDVRPSCKGDAVACAALFQLWSIRCENLADEVELSGEESCAGGFSCTGDTWKCAIAKSWNDQKCAIQYPDNSEIASIFGDQSTLDLDIGDTDLGSIASGVYSQTGASSSCPADENIALSGTTVVLSFQPACDLAAQVRPVVIFFFSVFAFRTLMGAF